MLKFFRKKTAEAEVPEEPEQLIESKHYGILSRQYWVDAAEELKSVKMICFAALIIALRVAVKMFKIEIASGLSLTFDCYINALGSIVYGPVVALIVGAVSDTLGCIIFPSGAYFFPFIFVEMSSSLIFALFLWRRKKITVSVMLAAKFTVNFICNIILTSAILKFQYFLMGDEKFYTYNVINGVRIVKNLILFPFEGVLISLIISALFPAMKALKIIPKDQEALKFRTWDIIVTVFLVGMSIGLVLFYIFFLKDFISQNNFKML